MPRTPDGTAALEQAHVVDGEADAAALGSGEQHVVHVLHLLQARVVRSIARMFGRRIGSNGFDGRRRSGRRLVRLSRPADRDAHDAVALVELHGDLAVAIDGLEIAEAVAAHVAGLGGEHEFQLAPGLLVLGQRQDRGDGLALGQGEQVDQRLADRLRGGGRQAPHLHAVDHAARGEEQHGRVRGGDENLRDDILLTRRHAGAALAAAALGAIGRERHAFDVAAVAHRHHHVLALDQVLVLDLALHLDDLGEAGRAELGFDVAELTLDDVDDARARGQDRQELLDLLADLLQLVADLVAAERGQALQAQIEDGAGLLVGQADGAVGLQLVARVGDQLHQRADVLGRPGARHHLLACLCRARRGANEPDHVVDVGDRHGEAHQHVRAVARLG